MSIRQSILCMLCITLAHNGCGKDDANSSAPATQPSTAPSTQKSIKEQIEELTDTKPLTTTRAATEPATRQVSTRPIRLELDPKQTVVQIFADVKNGNFTDMRELILEAPLSADLQRQFKTASAAMAAGTAKYEPIEEKVVNPMAMVIVRVTAADQPAPLYTPLLLYNKQHHWLVMLRQPNLRQFTIGERQQINDLSEWAKARLSALQGPSATQSASTTQSATAPAK